MTDISWTFGALLLGGIIAVMFSGVTWAQCVVYLKLYPNDQALVKLLVFGVWLLDTLHSVFVSQSLWNYLIVNFGVPDGIDVVPTSLALTIVVTAVLTFTVHCFFIYRVFILAKRNYFIAIPILLIAAARLCFASLTTSKLIDLRSLHRFVELYTWSFTTGLTLSAIVDILITGFMCYLLRRRRGQYSSLNEVLDTLILYAFENGILTTLAALISLITWLTMKWNFIFLATHFIIIKFYANSLLATLNARRDLKPGGITMHSTNLRSLSGATTMDSRQGGHQVYLSQDYKQAEPAGGNTYEKPYESDSITKVDTSEERTSAPAVRITVNTTKFQVTDDEPPSRGANVGSNAV